MIGWQQLTWGNWGMRGINCGAKRSERPTESRPIFLGINDLHVNAGVGEALLF